MSRPHLLLALPVLLSAACGGGAPPARGPQSGPAPVAQWPPPVDPAPPPGGAQPPPAGAQPNGSRACCKPSGAYDPSDTSYNDCVRAGGRPWGTDGCGRRPDGSILAPPPAMAPANPGVTSGE